MAAPGRYNPGGPLAGVVVSDTSGNAITMPSVAADGSQPIAGSNGTSAASAANPVPVKSASYNYLGYQQITAAALAASTPLTVPANATIAIIQNNTNQIARFRTDGATTAPTASLGQRIAVNGVATRDIGNAALTSSRFIVEAAATGTFDIEYFN